MPLKPLASHLFSPTPAGRCGVRQDCGGPPGAAGGGWIGLPGRPHGGHAALWAAWGDCSACIELHQAASTHVPWSSSVSPFRLPCLTLPLPHLLRTGPHRDPGRAALPQPAASGAGHDARGGAERGDGLPTAAHHAGGCWGAWQLGPNTGFAVDGWQQVAGYCMLGWMCHLTGLRCLLSTAVNTSLPQVTGSVTGKARRQINEQLENGEM